MSKTSPPPPAALHLYIIEEDDEMRRWLSDILSHPGLKIPVLVVGESSDIPLRRRDNVNAVIFNPEDAQRDLSLAVTMLTSIFSPRAAFIAHHDNWRLFQKNDGRITHGFATRDLAQLITVLKSIAP